MTTNGHQQDRAQNAAWRAAQQWQERARQARPTSRMSGPKLILTWLFFGVMMVVGTLLGLIFLLVGWAMMPFVRHKMKKRMDNYRAQHAEQINPDGDHGDTRPHQVLEGDYQVRPDQRG